MNGVFARSSEEDELGEGASVRKWTGTAVIAGCDASVGRVAKESHPAQAHSNRRLAPTTTAYKTDLDNLAVSIGDQHYMRCRCSRGRLHAETV